MILNVHGKMEKLILFYLVYVLKISEKPSLFYHIKELKNGIPSS